MQRARGVFATAGIALTLVAARVGAQAVTLPTIRANKTPERELLTQMVTAMREPANQPSKLRTRDDTLQFKCAMGSIALTPYTSDEVKDAGRAGESAIAAERAFRSANKASVPAAANDTVGFGQVRRSGFARSLNAVATKPTIRMPDGLAEILDWIPPACVLQSDMTQDAVHDLVEPYRAAEKDKPKTARLDSLERVASANVVQRELRERRLFSVRSHDDAVAFWKQPSASALNIGAISGGGDQGATYVELASRFLKAVRFSFSTVMATGKDSAATTPAATTKPTDAAKIDTTASGSTITRFLNGGGLLNVAAAYPLVHLGKPNGAADFVGLLAPRGGVTLPVLGANHRDTTLMYDAGAEFVFKSIDDLGGLGVYFQTRVGFAGGSPTFMRLIGDADQHHTGYQTVTGGITIDDRFVVTLSRTVSGPRSLQQTGWQVGVSLSRSASSPATGSP